MKEAGSRLKEAQGRCAKRNEDPDDHGPHRWSLACCVHCLEEALHESEIDVLQFVIDRCLDVQGQLREKHGLPGETEKKGPDIDWEREFRGVMKIADSLSFCPPEGRDIHLDRLHEIHVGWRKQMEKDGG